jgi:membrane associated rhomboid family serine protease
MEYWITIVIIGINVATSFYAWNNKSVLEKWMFNPYQVRTSRQFYRFITSGFIHNDYIHLLFNMFTLYFFGRVIEYAYQVYFGTAGIVYYLVLYLVGIVVADLPTYFKHKEQPYYNSLGASGGVAAVVFSSIIINPTSNIYIMGILPLPGFVLGILFLIYSYFQARKSSSNINHDAHFYGAVFGILFTLILNPAFILSFFDQVANFRLF